MTISGNPKNNYFAHFVWADSTIYNDNAIEIFFDEETMCELDIHPLNVQLREVVENFTKKKIFFKIDLYFMWKKIFRFIIFSFENVIIEDIESELDQLCAAFGHIDYDANFSNWVDAHREEFYDMEINDFLNELRNSNSWKGSLIKPCKK